MYIKIEENGQEQNCNETILLIHSLHVFAVKIKDTETSGYTYIINNLVNFINYYVYFVH